MYVPSASHCALILPGAVAKGAFEAGVIDVLVGEQVHVDRIVSTSSGSLNGVALAAGIRSGDAPGMAARLVDAWINDGDWLHALDIKPLSVLLGRGMSGRKGLLKMLQRLVTPCHKSVKFGVELRIIVTPLNGIEAKIGGKSATTYEKVLVFSGDDFDSRDGLDRIFEAATAACAFPGVFAPVEIGGLGPCVDGGTVNNAPIKYALDQSDVNRIIIPIPFPELLPPPSLPNGVAMANHLVEILINERLFRDLRDAQIINKTVARIDQLAVDGILTAAQAATVKKTIEMQRVRITEVRPDHVLGGSSFSGLFSRNERISLVEAGRHAAQSCLSRVEPEAEPHRKNRVE